MSIEQGNLGEYLDSIMENDKTEQTFKVLFLKKKNKAREEINKMGSIKKEGINTFDNYQYIKESQYKELLNKILVLSGLEFSSSLVENISFEGSEKQPNGKSVKMTFTLSDIDTGYAEMQTFDGEAIDKGDKALYKAYTGALKYFIANNFLIASDDDAEKDSPEGRYKTPLNAPESPITDEEGYKIPNCSICGKPMRKTKHGSRTPFYCKHGKEWGKPVYPDAPKTEEVQNFEEELF